MSLVLVSTLFTTFVDYEHFKLKARHNTNTPLASLSSQSSDLITLNWTYNTSDWIQASPMAADINGDGYMEILVGPCYGPLYCFNFRGEVLWTFECSNLWSTAALADIDKDGRTEIIFCATLLEEGFTIPYVLCLNYDGSLKWKYHTKKYIDASPTIADLDHDGVLEIIVSDRRGIVYCFSPEGSVLWSYSTTGTIFATACVADLDNDSYLEVLVGTWEGGYVGYLYCFNASGFVLWRFKCATITGSASALDIDDDGKYEIIFVSWDGYLYCLDNTGSLKWRYNMTTVASNNPAFADIDNDGTMEIFIGTAFIDTGCKLYCFNANGSVRWTCGTKGPVNVGSIIDLDGDGKLEILANAAGGYLYLIDIDGRLKWQYKMGASTDSRSFVADLNLDGRFEIVIGSEDWQVYCFSVNAPIGQASPWPCFMGSIFHTGWPDSDGDYIDDLSELYYGTNISSPDTDGDGFLDGWEIQVGLDPLFYGDKFSDLDGDGLTNFDEARLYHTSLFLYDTDGDGLGDGWEVSHGSDPLSPPSPSSFSPLYLLFILPFFAFLLFFLYRFFFPRSRH